MKAIIDCNSFYCACEKLFRPDLQNKAVVVLSNNDGCIISRSDQAKALGIKMAGPCFRTKKLVKDLDVTAFLSNDALYADISARVMETIRELAGADKVEVYSIYEAFIDMDHIPPDKHYHFCSNIKETIEQWTGIPVSVGAAPTKLLAKAANRLAKKYKQSTGCIMVADTEEARKKVLESTPVKQLWGIGKKNSLRLEHWGIKTAWDLQHLNEEWARKNLGGVSGIRLIRALKGLSTTNMREASENKKTISATGIFEKPVTEIGQLKEAVSSYVRRAAENLRRQSAAAKFINVFLVTNDYKHHYHYLPTTIHRYAVLAIATSTTNELIQHALPLIDQLYSKGTRYLKAGVVLTGLVHEKSIQSSRFVYPQADGNNHPMDAMKHDNFTMKDSAVAYAAVEMDRNWKTRPELRSPRYTTKWNELRKIS